MWEAKNRHVVKPIELDTTDLISKSQVGSSNSKIEKEDE